MAGNCAFCVQMRSHFLEPLKGVNIRVAFTTASGRGADRVEQFVRRSGKWIFTTQGQHHVKDIETIGRDQP